MSGFYTFRDNPFNEPQLQLISFSPYLSAQTLYSSKLIVSLPPTKVEIILNQFEINKWEILNHNEISLYLENNPDLVLQLEDALKSIPKIMNKPFKFRLKLLKDMEFENFATLCLFIAGNFTPKQAFNLLRKVDNKWTNKKNSDVSRFNISVEFI